MLAQGDYHKAFEMWVNLSNEYLFGEHEQELIKVSEVKWDMSVLSGAGNSLNKSEIM